MPEQCSTAAFGSVWSAVAVQVAHRAGHLLIQARGRAHETRQIFICYPRTPALVRRSVPGLLGFPARTPGA